MKTLAFFLAILFPFTLFSASCRDDCEEETDWTLEVRCAYYQPTSKELKRVYTSHLIDYQVTAAKRFCNYFEVWGELDWTVKMGHMKEDEDYYFHGFKNRSRLSLIPVSLGLKAIFPLSSCVDVYVGAGGTYSFLRLRNRYFVDYYYAEHGFDETPFKKETYKYAFGGLFKAGLQITLSSSTFLDIFADYISQRFHFSRHDEYGSKALFKHHLDCSGFKFGLGLGVYF